jgi:FkbM family methyltransferase
MTRTSFFDRSTLVVEDGELWIRPVSGIPGCLVFGPYITLAPGSYSLFWNIRISGKAPLEFVENSILELDITADNGHRVLFKRILNGKDLLESNGSVRVDFELNDLAADRVEFRAFGTGADFFMINACRTVYDSSRKQVFADEGFLGMEGKPLSEARHLEFVETHINALMEMLKCGVTFSSSDLGLLAEYNGIKFALNNSEDFHIFVEIFIAKCYRFEMLGRCMLFDVGMNTGLAALNFASAENVVSVHSFEPFATPRERALQNFEMNPKIASKIFPYPFGLYDEEIQTRVSYDQGHTIGTSIRGTDGHEVVSIKLCDASRILNPLIESARTKQLAVVLKLDCEGSEFPIIENLERSGVLRKIDVILMEWHKWWDEKKTERALIEPLIRNQFTVFDRTESNNPHAGLIIATNRAPV